MVSYPTHPTPLLVCKDSWSLTQPPYLSVKPMVSYPAPLPVYTDPWSLTQPPYLSVQAHGLLPNHPTPLLVCKDSWSLTQHPPPPPTCLYKPMVSYPAPLLVYTDPWSLTQSPHLSLETHGLLPKPPSKKWVPSM